ncbi:formyltransferase family protein [Salinibacter ruber]|uniref:formyltransferase family protein n=1 Tax=Salinibacter ruber TaxID=146919 RepID=UPI0021686132|nr:formyltransferase family protein [Salinibacter ruber]
MRIFYMGNNWLGWKVLEWLDGQGEEIVGLSVHPSPKQKYGDQILSTADLPDERVFDAESLEDEEVLDRIRKLEPNIGVSILFDYILKPPFLRLFEEEVINLHPAYLPYNRGQYPNVWSIVEGTPAGTTLHYIDPEIDTGDIIARKGVDVEPVDTGESLYKKLERASLELFKNTWPAISSGRVSRVEQRKEEGTYHRSDDVEQIDEIDLDESYKARDLINILRARTFPPHESAYFEQDGRRVYVRVNLEYNNNG